MPIKLRKIKVKSPNNSKLKIVIKKCHNDTEKKIELERVLAKIIVDYLMNSNDEDDCPQEGEN